MKTFHFIPLTILLLLVLSAACSKDTANAAVPGDPGTSGTPPVPGQKITVTVAGSTFTAIMYKNPTSRSFLSQLPLTADMNDFASTEKIFYPPHSLYIDNDSRGMHAVRGDIGVYAPWGNIALYYRGGSSFSNDMIPIGRLESGIDAFSTVGTLTGVRFKISETDKQHTP